MRLTLIACIVAGPVWATACPEPPDHGHALTQLIEAARDAPDEASGRALSDEMWALWADAPNARAQEMLDRAMARREVYDFDAAIAAAEELITYCPDYAEGYNQRAFVLFLREDFDAALPDLERALERQPRHVAAITGQALTLHALGRNAEAALALRRALDLNPWLGERHLLPALESFEQEL